MERRPIISVTIEPGGDYLGRLLNSPLGKSFRPDIDVSRRPRSLIEAEIRICFAGCLAESKRAGRTVRATTAGDFQMAVDLATYVTHSPEETTTYLDWLFISARQLVEREHHWQAVKALAGELLLKTTVSGKVARKIILEAAFGVPAHR